MQWPPWFCSRGNDQHKRQHNDQDDGGRAHTDPGMAGARQKTGKPAAAPLCLFREIKVLCFGTVLFRCRTHIRLKLLRDERLHGCGPVFLCRLRPFLRFCRRMRLLRAGGISALCFGDCRLPGSDHRFGVFPGCAGKLTAAAVSSGLGRDACVPTGCSASAGRFSSRRFLSGRCSVLLWRERPLLLRIEGGVQLLHRSEPLMLAHRHAAQQRILLLLGERHAQAARKNQLIVPAGDRAPAAAFCP